ncbi:hypothetical protein Hanom_Chr04g00306151 [Helianthus anomalus]
MIYTEYFWKNSLNVYLLKTGPDTKRPLIKNPADPTNVDSKHANQTSQGSGFPCSIHC